MGCLLEYLDIYSGSQVQGENSMTKIVGIIGSLRKGSVHRVLFNEYKALASSVFDLEEADISGIPLYNQDIQTTPESVVAVAKQIQNSDGVIFFSPEYNYSIPGVLKNAIDWLSREKPVPFAGKGGAIVGASPGRVGTARMQYHLRQVVVFLDLHMMNKPEMMISGAFDIISDGKLQDDKTKEYLKGHADSFKGFIKNIS